MCLILVLILLALSFFTNNGITISVHPQILRKLSFATDSPCASGNNYHRNKSRIAPSPYRSGKYVFNQSTDTCSTFDDLSYDEEYFQHSTNGTDNNLCADNNNVKKYFRIHRKSTKNELSNQKNMLAATSRNKNSCDAANKSIFVSSENIIFTENKIYIGLSAQQYNRKQQQQQQLYTIESNNCCKDNGNGGNCGMVTSPSPPPPPISNYCNYNGDEYNDKVRKETFDLSAAAAAAAAATSNSNVVAVAASMVAAEYEKHNLTTTNFGGTDTTTKCSRKLNFDEVQHQYEQQHIKNGNQTMGSYSRMCSNDNYEEVVFEKVKYDRTKKYLRTSPAHSSGSFPATPLRQYYNNNIMMSSDYNGEHEQQSDSARLSIYDNYQPCLDDERFICARNIAKNKLRNDEFGSKSLNPWDDDGRGKNMVTDEFILNDIYDPWHFLDQPNFLQKPLVSQGKGKSSKGHSINSGIHYEYVGSSSRRTSVSTMETWIDDEIFDNSFNEELEKRCTNVFER